ncbi:uncharacterized protein LOC128158344 [Crassostrea angulata]|uniref:Chitin-binding type-2 domain-containing protein n=3 Tax=Magallana gigas TaxID=29159 RepID=A0A8W8LLY7_MAGGI|nr:uncharacterized protein LOC117682841 [Crassostrea gigas]XP_052677094.1 uncharacterized protein LOC128158344 [Crassostrea angulata]
MKVFCLLAVVGIACAAPERAKRQLVPSNEHCNFQAPNPCSTSKTNTQVFFPHPNDNTKFIQCNAVGEMYIIQCPHGKLYNKATVSCVSQNYIPGGQGSGQIGGSVSLTSNPCTPENLAKGIIYFAVTGEKNKFIECDLNGNANVLTCPSLLAWDESRLSCVYSFQAGQPTPTPNTASLGGSGVTTNPCKNSVVTTGNTQFHSHPDPAKFIQCDIAGNAYVLACPSGLVWNEFSTTCVSPFTQAVGAPH